MSKDRKAGGTLYMIIAALLVISVMALAGCDNGAIGKEEKRVSSPAERKDLNIKEKKTEEGIVTISQDKQKEFNIKTAKASLEEIAVQVSTTAVIELNTDKLSKISPRISGKIVKVNVSQGDRVKTGQPLAYFDSPEIDLTWTEYLKTRSRLELARKNLLREETLFAKKVSPEKDVLKARQEFSETEADLMLSKEKFRILGIDISQFEEKKGNGLHPLIPISSPLSGVVVEKDVSQGEVVGPDKVLFVVADLSNLWVVIDIFEKDISLVRSGMAVKVAVSAFPDRVFQGRISYIGDTVDEKTRTVKARVTVDNSGGLLKSGMFAFVSIDTAKGTAEKIMTVPAEAVIMDGSAKYVFLQIGPERFIRKEISTGRTIGKRVVIREGLKGGDTFVTEGAFILKSELKKEELVEE